MKKNVIALMFLLSLGLVACGNKEAKNEEIPTENTEVVAEATEIEEVEETESAETAEEVVSGNVETVSEDDDSAVADTTDKKTENKKTDATANTNAGTSTGSNTASNAGNSSVASTPNEGNSNVVVAPEVPVTPAPTPTPTPVPDAGNNDAVADAPVQNTTGGLTVDITNPEVTDKLEVGADLGGGYTWGEAVGGLGTQTPTTDGYGDGTTITIEPVN